MIAFQDLPNTTTPINAPNLNSNFNELLKAQNAITLGLSNDYNFTLNGNRFIPLNTQIAKVGTKLSFDSTNHAIVVGEGVNHIEISATVLQKTDGADLCGFLITKNGSSLNNSVSTNFSYIPTTNQMFKISSSPTIVSVNENDKIYLIGYVNSGGTTATIVAYSGKGTYLTAKVID